jgi:predicted nucleic acid-binding OB-fold protein
VTGRERRVKVPERKSKDQPTAPTQRRAPAYGRPAPPAAAPAPKPEPPKKAPLNRSNPPNKGQGGRRPQQGRRGGQGGQRERRDHKPSGLPKDHPLRAVEWARVVEHDLGENVLIVVGEHNGTLGRIATKEGAEFQPVGARLNLKSDSNVVERLLGTAQLERLSPAARAQLVDALGALVKDAPAHFLKGFWNVAGHINIKTHAFQLLPGIGPKKAEELVAARNAAGGFDSFAALEEAAGFDGAVALASRFADELLDPNLQPRLVTMLLPVKA